MRNVHPGMIRKAEGFSFLKIGLFFKITMVTNLFRVTLIKRTITYANNVYCLIVIESKDQGLKYAI